MFYTDISPSLLCSERLKVHDDSDDGELTNMPLMGPPTLSQLASVGVFCAVSEMSLEGFERNFSFTYKVMIFFILGDSKLLFWGFCFLRKNNFSYYSSELCVPDIPIIPDLEDVQEEELTAQVALPPRYILYTSLSMYYC